MLLKTVAKIIPKVTQKVATTVLHEMWFFKIAQKITKHFG